MYFDYNLIPLIGLGCILIIFSKKLATLTLKPKRGRSSPKKGTIKATKWGIRFFGVFLTLIAVKLATSESTWYGKMIRKDSTRLALLEKGELTDAKVTRFYFQKGAPKGWAITYEFSAKNPETGKVNNWKGRSQGPKRYFLDVNEVTIIYDPCEPRLNLEIRCFLNKPSFRQTFEKADKLKLLDRFRDKFKLENLTSEEWYIEQQNK